MRPQNYMLCLVVLLLGTSSSWAQWEATITATVTVEGADPWVLTFGVHPEAKDRFDEMDIPLPPMGPPPIVLDAALMINDLLFPRLIRDIKEQANTNQWRLDVRSDVEDIRLTWDISGVPLGKRVLLKKGSRTVNMRTETYLDLAQGQHSLTLEAIPGRPDIAVVPTSWNYGDVRVGDYSDMTFTIFNPGSAALDVTATRLIGASGFSIQSGGGRFALLPGDTRDIVVRFAPVSARLRYRHATLRIVSNVAGDKRLCVRLRGKGRRRTPFPR